TNYGGSQSFVLGSKLMGCNLKNQQNEDLGTISNVVVNPLTGHIRYAVVNSDGKKVTIPWSAISAENSSGSDTPKLTANVTRDKLSNAPKFDPNNLQNLQSRSTEEPIWTYYELVWFPDVSSSEEQKARGQTSNSSTAGNGTAGTTGSTGTAYSRNTIGTTGTNGYPNSTPLPTASPH
ncbi:MAG TPA: PRC-barrel domain-containing protein, partial [Chthoniobacterales bacterium]|nr:PRC-barrel domain-containing protein [Chthoniobacterales bacterium]